MAAVDYGIATGYDPDDMFGLRRALGSLDERHRDRFFERWIELTERCDFDVSRIHDAVRGELAATDGSGPLEIVAAWETVDGAMAGYLSWRAGR